MKHHETELFGEPPASVGGIYHGTVGWVGDGELTVEGETGKRYVKVTLHEGAPPGLPVSPEGGANGRRIMAQLSWPNFAVPPRNAEVYLAIPAGLEESPGAALIIGSPQPAPAKQFEDQRMVMSYPGYEVVIKAKTVALISEDVDGSGKTIRHLVSVSQQGGAQVTDGTGSGVFVHKGQIDAKVIDASGKRKCSLSMTESEICLMHSAGSLCKLKGSEATMAGGKCSIVGMGGVLLKTAAPGVPLPLLVGPTPGVPAVGVFASIA